MLEDSKVFLEGTEKSSNKIMQSRADDTPSKEQILWFLSLAKPEIKLISIGMITLLTSTVMNLCIPHYSGELMDTVTNLMTNDGERQLTKVLSYMVLVIVVTGVSTFIRNYCMTVAGERIVNRLNKKLFKHVVKQDIAFFDENNSGELLNRLSSDTRSIQMALSLHAEYICRHIVEIVGCLIVLISISIKLLVFMLFLVPTGTIAITLLSRFVSRVSAELQDALARSSSLAQETLGNMRTVKSLGIQKLQTDKYAAALDEALVRSNRLALAGSISMSMTISMAFVSITGVLWFGGKMVLHKELTIGSLTSFFAYTVFVSYSTSNLSHWYFSMLRFLGCTKRVHDILHRKPVIDNAENAIELEQKKTTVEFRNVSFTYPTRKNTPVLRNINLTLKPGKIVALVGTSGGGKSTICGLLQRFYDPTEGLITIGGEDLRNINLHYLSKMIGTVSQEPHLFATSIYENISFGNPKATQEEIIIAAKKAHAHDFIMKFPNGYDTVCGEKGSLLSGGQKQRICLARCFIQQPEIILIDEGTSALDSESEHQVQKALSEVAQGRTVLMIAHRLSTVKMADEICVMQEGMIIERGTHSQLIQEQGVYHRLVSLQMLESQIE